MAIIEDKEIRVKLCDEACEQLKEKVYKGLSERLREKYVILRVKIPCASWLSERLEEEYALFAYSGIIKFETYREQGIFFRDCGIDEYKDVEGFDRGNGKFMPVFRQSLMND